MGLEKSSYRRSPDFLSCLADTLAFAAAVRSLILDGSRRAAFAAAAQARVRSEHDLPAAARRLAAVIDTLGRTCAAEHKSESLAASLLRPDHFSVFA